MKPLKGQASSDLYKGFSSDNRYYVNYRKILTKAHFPIRVICGNAGITIQKQKSCMRHCPRLASASPLRLKMRLEETFRSVPHLTHRPDDDCIDCATFSTCAISRIVFPP